MTHFENRDHPPKNTFNVFIGEEEWTDYSYESKLMLLYRLRQSKSELARVIEKPLSLLIEEEKNDREIDYEATLKQIEKSEN